MSGKERRRSTAAGKLFSVHGPGQGHFGDLPLHLAHRHGALGFKGGIRRRDPGADRLTARLAAAGQRAHGGGSHCAWTARQARSPGCRRWGPPAVPTPWRERSVKPPRTVTGSHGVPLVAADGSKAAAVDRLTCRE
ncbi:hypothetical protein ACFVT1_22130 [Streptomyces sp. NPDC057963]|uniref:hypothetical protein n=1 Tax=Streptomyces sp. NPDC057963 TaxID=3346290 RepID=UPI0036E5A29F